MAEDLGSWPPEQATVLLEVLTNAGLSPRARRTRQGIVVTVDDAEADKAHRTLVENMDAIARAARRPGSSGQPRRKQTQASTSGEAPQRPLATQRLSALARPVGILLIGLMLAAIIPPLRLPIVIFTVAAIVYVLGRQQPGDEDR